MTARTGDRAELKAYLDARPALEELGDRRRLLLVEPRVRPIRETTCVAVFASAALPSP